MVIVIDMGCAECGSNPLGTAEVFESIDEAKAQHAPATWKPHPQGGEYYQTGSGGAWILPEKIEPFPKDYDWALNNF